MRKIVRASARVSASSGALPMSARANTGEIAPTLVAQTSEGRGGTAGPMQLVPPMKAYNITPESGQGADLRACEVTTSTAVTVTEHAKQTDRGIRVDETTTSPTITAGGDPTERTDRGLRIVGERKDPVDCVTANSVQHYDVKSAQAGHLLGTTTAVRRLTPTECERLQGFPDGWTVVEGVKPVPRAKKKAR